MHVFADVRHALRLLARSPLFTITAVLSLAAGIAASTAIFSLTDALVLRPRAGIADPDRVVDVGRASGRGTGFDNFGYPLFQMLQARATAFESMAATEFAPNAMSLGDGTSSERVFGLLVSGNYFQLLGTRAAAGRFFLAEEDRTPGTHPVIVLSHVFWQRRFGGRTDVVGTTLSLNGRPYAIVGVAEAGFTGTTFVTADFWVPFAMTPDVRGNPASDVLTSHDAVWHGAIGRVKPGVTTTQARAELNQIFAAIKQEQPAPYAERDWQMAVAPSARMPVAAREPVYGFLALLFTLTGIVLLIACSNVAGMLLARATARRREMATRLALGASRGRLLTQLVTETIVIYLIAVVASLLLTFWIVRALGSFMPMLPVPVALDLDVDIRAFSFALAIALATGLAFGLSPARHALRLDLATSLHGQYATSDRRRVTLRQALVVGQVALSLLLLVTTGLLLRALQASAQIDPGFEPRHVEIVTLDVSLAGARDQQAVALVDRIAARLRTLPGVEAVAASRVTPLEGSRMGLGDIAAPGTTSPDGTDVWPADWDIVSPDYFATLRLPIVAGRGFTDRDRDGQPGVAIINETFARRVWPGQDAVGQRLIQYTERDRGGAQELTVVGVARDAKYARLDETTPSFIYVPFAQQPRPSVSLYIRHAAGRAVQEDIRTTITTVEPRLPAPPSQPLERAITIALLPQRIAAWIAGGAGSLGLLLAALGLYGLTAFAVAQRTREIAVRMAVGATPRAVLHLILGSSARLAALGTAAGLLLAFAASLVLRSVLIGLGEFDVTAFAAAAVLLTIVLLVASWLPARRATRLDAAATLKGE